MFKYDANSCVAFELGVTPDMFDGIASATFIMDGGYKTLSKDDVVQILKESI